MTLMLWFLGIEVVLDVPSGDCFHYMNVGEKVQCSFIPEIKLNHEEADAKIVRHATAADKSTRIGDVVVRSHDTDIAVILVYHCEKMEKTVWMDLGTVSKKNRRFINITEIQRSLGPGVCKSLPTFKAFTGSELPPRSWKRERLEHSPDFSKTRRCRRHSRY